MGEVNEEQARASIIIWWCSRSRRRSAEMGDANSNRFLEGIGDSNTFAGGNERSVGILLDCEACLHARSSAEFAPGTSGPRPNEDARADTAQKTPVIVHACAWLLSCARAATRVYFAHPYTHPNPWLALASRFGRRRPPPERGAHQRGVTPKRRHDGRHDRSNEPPLRSSEGCRGRLEQLGPLVVGARAHLLQRLPSGEQRQLEVLVVRVLRRRVGTHRERDGDAAADQDGKHRPLLLAQRRGRRVALHQRGQRTRRLGWRRRVRRAVVLEHDGNVGGGDRNLVDAPGVHHVAEVDDAEHLPRLRVHQHVLVVEVAVDDGLGEARRGRQHDRVEVGEHAVDGGPALLRQMH
eukprot:5511069-Prymnesium_polylepis.1